MLRSEDGVSGISSADGTSSVGSLVGFFEGKATGSSGLCSFGPVRKKKKRSVERALVIKDADQRNRSKPE